MLPEDVTRLRETLGWSMSALARALEVPANEIVAWESGERFPTRKAVRRMQELLAEHGAREASTDESLSTLPSAPPLSEDPPWTALADPELWRLLRQLAAYSELRAAVRELAAAYPDPAEPR